MLCGIPLTLGKGERLMKAVLMAAGMGRRISSFIEVPKSTLPIEDTTIIRHTVQMLLDNGIEVAVVVGYRKKDIYKALEGLPVTYYFNPFFKVTNSMASLWFAQDFLDPNDGCILANADVFWEQEILDILLNDTHDIAMLGDKNRGQVGDYCFELTKDGFINDYGKELSSESKDTEYVGVAKISSNFTGTFKELLNKAVELEVYDLWWENVLYGNCILYPVYVHDISSLFWAEVDVMSDYQRILKYLADKKKQ